MSNLPEAEEQSAEATDRPPIGLAHVATASFLASRVTPSGGFAVALAGGVAIARTAQRWGTRMGFGASTAAMLQTIAIMGPLRVTIPLTQAIGAPLLGTMEARGRSTAAQFALMFSIRTLQNLVGLLFYVLVIAGVDAYFESFRRILGWIPFMPNGDTAVWIGSISLFLLWGVGATVIQVLVYQRGLRRWPADPPAPDPAPPNAPPGHDVDPGPLPVARRFDPRAVVLAAAVAFAILLTGTWWIMLGAVALWLAVAWAFSRGNRDIVKPGLILAGIIMLGTLIPGIVGGQALELTARRMVRAALLVLVATWMGYAAGEEGLREVFRRLLRRFRRIPALAEAGAVLDGLGSTQGLAASGKRLIERLKGVEPDPLPITDAVLEWVAGESGRHAPGRPGIAPQLHVKARDGVLVVLAACCALSLPLVVG
jgi:hypothetical protein